MHHSGAVGRLEPATDLFGDAHDFIEGKRPFGDQVAESSCAAQPCDEIRRVRLAPVVVQGQDVRMLELGDELCVRLEAADEVGLVRTFGSHDRDGDISLDRGLMSTVRGAGRCHADLLTERVAANGQPGRVRRHRNARRNVEGGVAGQDLGLQPAQRFGRIETEFLGEPVSQQSIRPQRIDLATRPVQRQHQLAGQLLAQRMQPDQGLQLMDELSCPTATEIRLDARTDRLEAERFEAADLRLGELLVLKVRERGTSP